MSRRRGMAASAAILALISACGGVPASGSPAVGASPASQHKVVTSLRREPARATDATVDLGATLTIERLDRATSDAVLAFASSGTSIVFSAGLGPEAHADAAPDLWRVTPGTGGAPELVWRNPARDHVLTALAADIDTIAFVDMPVTGERSWELRVVTRDGASVVLDRHPGDAEVSGLVPSAAVYDPVVVWTAFDRGPAGPVSQLLTAAAPDWTPRVLLERDAARAELWFPSLYGNLLAFTEVVYDATRTSDERQVHLWDLGDPAAEPRRIDTSGLATMPQLVGGATVVWKEAEPGFNMFNWGRLFRYDVASGTVAPIHLGEDREYVTYPSAGARFVASWASTTTDFGVYDVLSGARRGIEQYADDGTESILRAHVRGDLLAWLWVDDPPVGPTTSELRYAWLPGVRDVEP